MKVVHLALSHSPNDVRIFHKECKTLSNNNYEVIYLTGQKDEKINQLFDQVTIETYEILPGCSPIKHPIRWFVNRHVNSRRLLNLAKKYDADIYHFHELTLIHLAKKLKKFNHSLIIYDVHEDYPREMIEPYTNNKIKYWIAKILSFYVEISEVFKAKKMDAIVAATPYIGKRFSKFHKNVTVICNYAMINERIDHVVRNENWICYAGNIGPMRGLTQLVDAIAGTKIRLQLAGLIPDNYYNELKNRIGWANVDYHGMLSREEVRELYASSSIGMLPFLNGGNSKNGLPNKLFEYMEASIPIIASNFPHWRKIIKDAKCGICVNPYNVKNITSAIQYLLEDRSRRERMGYHGRQKVESIYNWDNEAVKLIALYKELINNDGNRET